MDGLASLLGRWTRPHPSISGDADRRRARLAAGLLLALLPLCLVAFLLLGVQVPPGQGTLLTGGASLAVLAAFALVRSGRVGAGIGLAILAVDAVLAFGVRLSDEHLTAMLILTLFAIPIAMAGVLLRTRPAMAAAAGTVLLALVLDATLDHGLLGAPDDHAYLIALLLGGVAVLAVAASATVQAQAQALAEAAGLLRQVTENLPAVMFVIDADGRPRYTNPAYETMTGRKVEQALADPLDWLKAVHPDDLPRVKAELAAGRPEIEYRILHPSGDVRDVHARTVPVLGKDGRPVRLVGIVQDLTAIRRAQRLAAEAQQQRTRLMQQIAHDLASPLSPVKIQLRLLEGHVTEKGRHGLAVVRRNVEHVQRLVEDLRDVVRLEEGELRLERRPTDLAELARQTAETLAPAAAERGVRLEAAAPAPVAVSGDPGRLTQVLYNLASNALKFTPAGGTVELRAEAAPDGQATVTVRDTGTGMRPDQLERLFRPFSQVHEPGSLKRPEDRGTGLGLYISKGLVEAHGGSLRAESAGPGRGSTFTFRLPLLPPA